MSYAADLEALVGRLNVDKSGGERKPHKPLLLLYALARLLRRGERELPFDQVEADLEPLLLLYAPPVDGRPEPKLPYWHLRNDDVWEVNGADSLQRNAKGFPRMAELRATSGRLPERYARALEHDAELARRVVRRILDEHFEPSLHEDVLAAVGFDDAATILAVKPAIGERVADAELETVKRRARPRGFRDDVLAAYEHRCALSGFRAELSGVAFGIEAAHVHWHSKGGPSRIANGIALEPTLHKLLDHGAWTLTDDRRVLVSRAFSGSDSAVALLRARHGQRLRDPLPGCEPVAPEFIRWHRESHLGGVFRSPPLPL